MRTEFLANHRLANHRRTKHRLMNLRLTNHRLTNLGTKNLLANGGSTNRAAKNQTPKNDRAKNHDNAQRRASHHGGPQSMSTVFASGYKCSSVPGSILALAIKASTSGSCNRMTRPNLYAGSCPSSMNLYSVRKDTPRRPAASFVDNQRWSDEAMPTSYPSSITNMCDFYDLSILSVTGQHHE